MTEERPRFSHTQLAMLCRCAKQYEYRYIEGRRRPPGISLVMGKAVHTTVEQDLRSKIDSGELLDDEAIPDIAKDAVEANWLADEPVLTPEEKSVGKKKIRGQCIDAGVAMANCHHSDLAPELDPEYVERPFRIEIQELDHDLIGFLDVQEKDRTVRDTKTGGKSPPKTNADNSMQLTIYALAGTVLDGETPKKLTLDHLIKTEKAKKAKPVVLETTRNEAQLKALLQRIKIAEDFLKAGVFPPCDPSNWCCSERWCGYWDRCPFGQAAAVSVPITRGKTK